MKHIMTAPRWNKEEKIKFLNHGVNFKKKEQWKAELYLRDAEFKKPKSLSLKYGEPYCFEYSVLLFTFTFAYVWKKKPKTLLRTSVSTKTSSKYLWLQ